jgi:hypothetical protein
VTPTEEELIKDLEKLKSGIRLVAVIAFGSGLYIGFLMGAAFL